MLSRRAGTILSGSRISTEPAGQRTTVSARRHRRTASAGRRFDEGGRAHGRRPRTSGRGGAGCRSAALARRNPETPGQLRPGTLLASPRLSGRLPESGSAQPRVPDWPQFLRGCIKYRESLDRDLPDAPRVEDEYQRGSIASRQSGYRVLGDLLQKIGERCTTRKGSGTPEMNRRARRARRESKFSRRSLRSLRWNVVFIGRREPSIMITLWFKAIGS